MSKWFCPCSTEEEWIRVWGCVYMRMCMCLCLYVWARFYLCLYTGRHTHVPRHTTNVAAFLLCNPIRIPTLTLLLPLSHPTATSQHILTMPPATPFSIPHRSLEANIGYTFLAMSVYFDRDTVALPGIAKFFRSVQGCSLLIFWGGWGGGPTPGGQACAVVFHYSHGR